VEARVREVAESRRRLVEASDVERRRLREQLRAGAELRLARVGDELQRLAASRNGSAAATLEGLAAELAAARGDLARFAQGVHPQALTDHGLAAALRALAAQAAVPVELEVAEVRLPGPHEAAAYFVCSEALANVGKYAEASRTQIAVAASRARLVVRVSDDGKGGADPRNGSGLRGLADRVEALGGQLSVHSPAGEGTTLTAELPITGMAAR
jgi:signal transduction histidine kinase